MVLRGIVGTKREKEARGCGEFHNVYPSSDVRVSGWVCSRKISRTACSMYGGDEKLIQQRKLLGGSRSGWEDNALEFGGYCVYHLFQHWKMEILPRVLSILYYPQNKQRI
jgi:hypothetical protein